jgi:soluble lytic murein transglycosylase
MQLASHGGRLRVLSWVLGGAILLLMVGGSVGAQSAGPAHHAVQAALSGKPVEATALARQSGDRAAVKLVEWLNVTENWKAVGYDRIMAFMTANPDWPRQALLERRAEWLLFAGKPSREQVLKHFEAREPVSSEGRIALARALQAGGETKRAAALIAEAWNHPQLSDAAKRAVQREFGSVLTRSVMEARIWRLIHAHRVTEAEQRAKRISKVHGEAAHAATHLIREERVGLAHYKKLPAAMRNKRALLYALARYYRRSGQTDLARDILLKASAGGGELIDPEAWWIERRIIVRQSIGPENRMHWPAAYKIAAAHGITNGPLHNEGDFLAGWIALRMLDDPETALEHFQAITEQAANHTEASRAHYWTGRAWLALGEPSKAGAAFAAAADFPRLYYGQLAREALGLGNKPVPLTVANPSDMTRATVEKDELVRAFQLLADVGARSHKAVFLTPIAARFHTSGQAAAVAAIVDAKGGAFHSIRFAKRASAHGTDIDDWSYPYDALPEWTPRGNPVELALILGLTRQESEFNPVAGSHAGARGLMQIMPATGRMIARQHKVAYDVGRLTSDPAYNVMLGAAHLGDLTQAYRGSYILALVAYNAGPGRVRQWIERYGDPRADVDPIDWIESVPFTETRRYIQKVLENVQVYRARLDAADPLPITADLWRGGTAPPAPAMTASGEHKIVPAACSGHVTQAGLASVTESC